MATRFVRMRELIARSGLSKSTIHRLVKAGKFPTLHKITERTSGAVEEEFDHWLAERATGESAEPPAKALEGRKRRAATQTA